MDKDDAMIYQATVRRLQRAERLVLKLVQELDRVTGHQLTPAQMDAMLADKATKPVS